MIMMELPSEPSAKGSNQVYRVVQWATGRVGQVSLRELIGSPQFNLVGVYVHSSDKVGRDAGELCGLPCTGVIATGDLNEIIALRPDCIVANPEGPNVDDMCRILSAGINVATSLVYYIDPAYMDQRSCERIEKACEAGGASIHGTGSSPGFSSETLPLVMASMSRRIKLMTIDEFADIPASCPDFQVLQMGFGREPAGSFDSGLLRYIGHGFFQSLNVIATGLSVALDEITISGETANCTETISLSGGTEIEAGTVGAQRISISAIYKGRPLVTFRINWYATTLIDQDWSLRPSGWRIVIEGDTPITAEIAYPEMSIDAYRHAMAGSTAYRVINAVPAICAAAPGIRTSIELPLIVPRLS